MMHLLQQLFCYVIKDSDSADIAAKKRQRQKEHDDCFKHNVALPFIKKHHVFLEKEEDGAYYTALAGEHSDKLVFNNLGKQAHYGDYLLYSTVKIPAGEVICIMNGDLFIDTGFEMPVIKKYLHGNAAFGLTRHEYTDVSHSVCNRQTCGLIYNYMGSHDTFLFRTPLLPSIDYSKLDFRQNLYGAENVMHNILAAAGYRFTNPCLQLRTFHNHKDSVYFEEYKRINRPGAYYGERPCKLL